MSATFFRIFIPLLITLAAIMGPARAAGNDMSPDYLAYRQKALKTTPSDLHINVDGDEPFGVVADIGFSFGAVTVVVFKNGDASMYNSQGGYRRGGDKASEEIRTGVQAVMTAASMEVPRMKKTADFGVVHPGHFRVYVLTPAGVFYDDSDWPEPDTPVYSLVEAVNQIITAYRHLEPGQKDTD